MKNVLEKKMILILLVVVVSSCKVIDGTVANKHAIVNSILFFKLKYFHDADFDAIDFYSPQLLSYLQ